MPSIERLTQLLLYDAATGVLTWKVSTSNRVKVGAVAGCRTTKGYGVIRIDGRLYKTHRVVVFMTTGADINGLDVDHYDGAKGRNVPSNLRPASRQTNVQNQRVANRDSRTGLLGVSQVKTGYRAQIGKDGCNYHIGIFKTPEEAHSAYVSAKRQMHAGCTL